MSLALFRDDAYLRECRASVLRAGNGEVVLDRSIFYPTGGGQPGDTGVLLTPAGERLAVSGTVKGEGDEIVLQVAAADGQLAPGMELDCAIDWPRRHRLMRFHTCLHLLCAVVGAPVTGGKMAEDKAHLDFDVDIDQLDAARIDARLAELIAADLPVDVGAISDAELDANPGLVKTMSVQPPRGQGSVRTVAIPGVDLQPCGGTHLARTGEIGAVKVVKIRSEGKRNKRVTIAFVEDSA